MAKTKAKERREVGVSERTDGIPRFELHMRWTNKLGGKEFLTKRFVFDPNAKSGPSCRAQALDNANTDAILERTSRRLYDKSRSRSAEAWTVGDLLERLMKELAPRLPS